MFRCDGASVSPSPGWASQWSAAVDPRQGPEFSFILAPSAWSAFVSCLRGSWDGALNGWFYICNVGSVEANRKVLTVVERVERVGATWRGWNHGLVTVFLLQVLSQTDAIFRFFSVSCDRVSMGCSTYSTVLTWLLNRTEELADASNPANLISNTLRKGPVCGTDFSRARPSTASLCVRGYWFKSQSFKAQQTQERSVSCSRLPEAARRGQRRRIFVHPGVKMCLSLAATLQWYRRRSSAGIKDTLLLLVQFVTAVITVFGHNGTDLHQNSMDLCDTHTPIHPQNHQAAPSAGSSSISPNSATEINE